METKLTRKSFRTKRLNQNIRKIDEETRAYILQSRIDELESDFYDSPNRLAEEDSEQDFDLDFDEKVKAKQKLRKMKKKIPKKNKKDAYVKRNLNLKKIIKEENLENKQVFPNFCNIKTKGNEYPQRKFCSICGNFSKYECPRCGEKYCCLKCHDIHKDIKCLKFDL